MNQTREDKLAAAKARMVELAAKFIDRTAGDLATMRAGMARFESGDGSGLEEVRHLAHRMAGTGATLGFENLSDRARRVELLIDAIRDGKEGASGARLELGTAFDSLESEVRLAGGH